jgi:hypothetical protein
MEFVEFIELIDSGHLGRGAATASQALLKSTIYDEVRLGARSLKANISVS